MDGMEVAAWVQAASGVLTMGAAFIALRIAAKAPESAARFAEAYRAQSASADDLRRLQMNVASSLVRCRAELMNGDARAAVNLADFAFPTDAGVKEARRLFLEAASTPPENANLIVERYHNLTWAVIQAVGLSDDITAKDVRSGWYPDAMAKLDAAAIADAEEKIARRASQRLGSQFSG